MDQVLIGAFIAEKRKDKNMTQAKLAELIGVSNKTISKWETGKCMPDYSVIEQLCKELDITVSELMDGEEIADNSIRPYDDEQVLDLLKRTQQLEWDKKALYGIVLIIMGIALQSLHYNIGGTDVMDFMSGLLLGLSISIMIAGVVVVGYCLGKRK